MNLIGLLVFFSVMFTFLGLRSLKRFRVEELKRSLDGNYTVQTKEEKEKKPIYFPFFTPLFVQFKKAGFRLKGIEFSLILVVIAIMGYFIFSYLMSSSYGLIGSAIAIIVFRVWIHGQVKKRTLLLRGQFANALVRMASSLKAQIPLEEAIRMVTDSVPEPLKTEFIRIYQYHQTERSIIKALKIVSEQIPLEEFHLFVISAEIHREVGGDLPELMEKLSITINDKQDSDKKLQAYSVQGKNNAMTVGLLPIGFFLFFKIFVPEFMDPLTSTTTGQFILFYCFSSILFGWWYVRKMADVTLD